LPALRYFRIAGEFAEYEHPDITAKRLVDSLLSRRRFVIGRGNRLKLIANDLFRGRVNRKVQDAWKA
jgi:hypothetical protein